jgi:ribosomal protein S18 acetylase RimI-like enzyme
LRQLYLGYITDPDAVVSVARSQDGCVIGICVGTINPPGFFSRLLKRNFFGFFRCSLSAVLRDPRVTPRLLAALTYRGDVPPGLEGALLSSLCVDPGVQHVGIGRALDEGWRLRASERGAQTAFLTTDADGNDAVNRFYERGGWLLNDQYVTRQGRRMNRYRRSLAPVETESNDG